MLSINEGGDASVALDLGDGMQGQCGLAGAFRAVNLDNAPLGISTTQGEIKGEGTCGNRLDPHPGCVPKAHDRSLAEIALDLTEHEVERFITLTGADISTGGLGGFHIGWHG